MLDNVDDLGSGKCQGRFGERQLAFVSKVLRQIPANRLVVAARHLPLRSYLDPNDPSINTLDGLELLKIIADRPSVSFSARTHTTEHHAPRRSAGRIIISHDSVIRLLVERFP